MIDVIVRAIWSLVGRGSKRAKADVFGLQRSASDAGDMATYLKMHHLIGPVQRFWAKLSPSTPLALLRKTGEVCPFHVDPPSYCDATMGVWLYETNSLDVIMGKVPVPAVPCPDRWKRVVRQTFLGDLCGWDVLLFLTAFRKIVESELSVADKRKGVRALCEASITQQMLQGRLTGLHVQALMRFCDDAGAQWDMG